MASHVSELPNPVPRRRSSGPTRRTANIEGLICRPAHRIMAKPELPALRQPRLFDGHRVRGSMRSMELQ